MTKRDVLDVIRLWIDGVINIENGLGETIIFTNQNAPRPAVPYITIQDPFITDSIIGAGNWGKWNYTDEPTDTGEVKYSILHESTIQIEVIGSDGDEFRLLENSLRRQDIINYFYESKVSILRLENSVPAVAITDDYIEKRVMKDIMVAWTDEDEYDPSYIGTVDTDGSYTRL